MAVVHFVFEHKVHLKLAKLFSVPSGDTMFSLFVCWRVSRIKQKLLDGYQRNLVGGWGTGKERIHKTLLWIPH